MVYIVSFDDINLESGLAFCAKSWSMEALQVAFCVDIEAETTESCLFCYVSLINIYAQ